MKSKEELEALARESANKESSLGNIETNEEWESHRDGYIFGYQKCEAHKLAIPIVSIPSGLHDRTGNELKLGDRFKYFKHDGYLLDDFIAEVVFENGAFCYKVIEGDVNPYHTAFCEHHELKHDFLDWIEIVK